MSQWKHHSVKLLLQTCTYKDPHHEKTCLQVSDQIGHKLNCTTTKEGERLDVVVVVVLGFYVSPTAKVIQRRDLGLKSNFKDLRGLKFSI